jgi:hypothetical protein
MKHATSSILFSFGLTALPLQDAMALTRSCPEGFNDEPVVPLHIEQAAINSGALSFYKIRDHGERLFRAKFNYCDGAGRPQATGGGDKRAAPTIAATGEVLDAGQAAKLRTSAPDSDSCAGCHNDPEAGGAGDFVANVFVLAQTLDPPVLSVHPDTSNSRNTLGMHGAGPIEMLAREMTADLQSQLAGLPDGVHTLTTKGVDFEIEIAGGRVVAAEGIDHDLVVRPFHQAGKVVSLREFSNNAMNHHHGMQAEERFDLNPAKGLDPDFDGDGLQRELTIGDQTALAIWQAQLSTPVQVMPEGWQERRMVRRGEHLFDQVGCTSCHIPEMVLERREFVEPNPYNPQGSCASAADGCPEYAFDMTRQGDYPRLERAANGTAIVRAYTDLKRHNLCDDQIRWYCNERLAQGRPEQDGEPGAHFFLTRKLWDVGSSAPYGHRGDVSTIWEAIDYHGGEARASRDDFMALPDARQQAIVKFLKTLQVVPQEGLLKGGRFAEADQGAPRSGADSRFGTGRSSNR